MSDKISITYGVPQGSVLGPILLIWCVNKLCHVFSDCLGIQYADDMQFIHTGDINDTRGLMGRGEECKAKTKYHFIKNGL